MECIFTICVQRKLPSPGFQVEVVLVDYDAAAVSARPPSETTASESAENSGANTASRPGSGPVEEAAAAKNSNKDNDDEFSDSESEETASSKSRPTGISSQVAGSMTAKDATPQNNVDSNQIANLTRKTEQVSLGTSASTHTEPKKEAIGGTAGTQLPNSVGEVSEFKAMAADASVFSFGDDEDYESE